MWVKSMVDNLLPESLSLRKYGISDKQLVEHWKRLENLPKPPIHIPEWKYCGCYDCKRK